jgi:hypothetical protein
MYYQDKIKPLVLQERGPSPLSKSESLSLIKRVTAAMWAEESEEVKAAVARKVAEAISGDVERGECDEVMVETGIPGLPSRSPSDFQRWVFLVLTASLIFMMWVQHRAINDVSPLLMEVLKALSDETGWAFSVLMGGPSPVAGGTIASAR